MNHLRGRGCRTDHELALLRTTNDLTPSQIKRLAEPTVKLGLGNMRANGVHTPAAWCLGRGCNYYRVLDVSAYPDELAVLSNYI